MTLPVSGAIHRRKHGNANLDELAAQALAYLAEDPDRLLRFFAETGLSPGDLRSAAAAPGFALTLLDYLATDEKLFVGFAQDTRRDPGALDALRHSLSPRDAEP